MSKSLNTDVEEILSTEQAECSLDSNDGGNEQDPLFDQAVEVIVRTQKVTISSLIRHLNIGFFRAAAIIDQLSRRHRLCRRQR